MKLRTGLLVIGIALLTVLTIYRSVDPSVEQAAEPAAASFRLNQPASGFKLDLLGGGEAVLTWPREKPVMINFWASWCGPCREEAPALTEMYTKYKDKLDMYAVNMTGQDDFDQAKAFVAKYKFEFPVLLDYKLAVAQQYGIQVIPTSYLIDRNGKVVDIINLLEPDELDKRLKKLVNG